MGPEIVKRLLYILAPIFFFSTFLIAVAQDELKNPIIESIEVIAGNDKPEQVVFKLNGSHTPTIFRLNGDTPRLVLDFYGIKYPSKIDRISDVGGDIIAGVRVGRHNEPQKIRVVVDIQQDSPYQYDQTFNFSENSLVVTLAPDLGQTAEEEQATSQPQRIRLESAKVIHGQAETGKQPESSETLASEQETTGEQEQKKADSVPVSAAEPSKEERPTAPPSTEESAEPDPTAQQADQVEEIEPEPAEPDPVAQQPDQGEEMEPILLDISFEKSVNKS